MHNLCMKNDYGLIHTLDRYDTALLAAVQQDAQTTHAQLGEKVSLSASQVSRRIQRLEASGVIERTVALLSPERLGLGVRAISYVTLSRHGGDEGPGFERAVRDIPEVVECFAVTGESDYILKIFAADLQTLSESVLKRLTRLPGVAAIRSNIVLQCVKSTSALPMTHLTH